MVACCNPWSFRSADSAWAAWPFSKASRRVNSSCCSRSTPASASCSASRTFDVSLSRLACSSPSMAWRILSRFSFATLKRSSASSMAVSALPATVPLMKSSLTPLKILVRSSRKCLASSASLFELLSALPPRARSRALSCSVGSLVFSVGFWKLWPCSIHRCAQLEVRDLPLMPDSASSSLEISSSAFTPLRRLAPISSNSTSPFRPANFL